MIDKLTAGPPTTAELLRRLSGEITTARISLTGPGPRPSKLSKERPEMKNALDWFPLHVDSWLFGSTRIELNPAQRGVFVDLLALSMKDEGYIRANEDTPYPPSQLAGLLFLDVDLLAETIERCVQVGKITRSENGILRISSYEKYQLPRMTRWAS